jgi:hypothetical protein
MRAGIVQVRSWPCSAVGVGWACTRAASRLDSFAAAKATQRTRAYDGARRQPSLILTLSALATSLYESPSPATARASRLVWILARQGSRGGAPRSMTDIWILVS